MGLQKSSLHSYLNILDACILVKKKNYQCTHEEILIFPNAVGCQASATLRVLEIANRKIVAFPVKNLLPVVR